MPYGFGGTRLSVQVKHIAPCHDIGLVLESSV
jgi:hypothetical protein